MAEYAYEAMFVPETKDLFPLLAEMQTEIVNRWLSSLTSTVMAPMV